METPVSAASAGTGPALHFLECGGELGELMRRRDWSRSPLGEPATWPPALRTVVSLMLCSKFPMFLAWGEELSFLYNDAYIPILGGKHPAALGEPFAQVWSEIWTDIAPLVARAMAGEATYWEKLPLTMHRRGFDEPVWFTFSYSPIRDEQGGVAGLFCANVEVTGQVLAERYRDEENQRLIALFDQAPGFIAVLHGPGHVYELANRSYLELIGSRDVIGLPIRSALPELKGQGFYELLDQVYASGEAFVGNAVPVRLASTPGAVPELRYLDFIYQPIRDPHGSVVGIFVEGSDVTLRKQIEDELRAANRQKDQFLAMLAHELRNPLAPITTAAHLLKTGKLDAKAVRNASEIIARQADHMTSLVNDLLDVSRVTRGLVALEKEELDVNAVVTGALEQVRPLIEAKRHALTMELSGEPVHVLGDRTRLVQVLSNILNNAAKYTPSGGQIALRVTAHGARVTVTVCDNGIGIEPDVLPYIFDLFTQAERTPDRSQGGLGIGLALVKSLVVLHGGTVAARAAPEGERGSEFEICLPRLEVDAALPAIGAAPNAPQQLALRVLVVDDNRDAAELLGTVLELQGNAVSVEYDGRSALQRARQERPQVLLLDIGLPDTDGYALARQLRAIPELHGAVLVALTGYGQPEDRRLAEEAGFDHHLVKPADLNLVSEILAQVQGASR